MSLKITFTLPKTDNGSVKSCDTRKPFCLLSLKEYWYQWTEYTK